MTTNNQYVFVNGMKEDGEADGFPLYVFDYGVGIGDAQGFGSGGGGIGSGDGGHGSEAGPSEVIIDKEFDENLEIFEVEIVARQEHLFLQLEVNQKF
jgi:hypothetical protein